VLGGLGRGIDAAPGWLRERAADLHRGLRWRTFGPPRAVSRVGEALRAASASARERRAGWSAPWRDGPDRRALVGAALVLVAVTALATWLLMPRTGDGPAPEDQELVRTISQGAAKRVPRETTTPTVVRSVRAPAVPR
jgi:hypothetical protein